MHRLRRLAAQIKGAEDETGGPVPSACSAAQAGAAPTGPLAGTRVVDLSSVISGPFATSILADQGAEVIKVEAPNAPDMTRGLGPNPGSGMGAMYVSANRGKRSITLDVQKPKGLELLKELVRRSDVVVQNYRPGVAERLGCDYAGLRAVKSDIIVLSISGFGSSGPYVDAKVYDQVVQAMTGVPSIMSDGGQPVMFHNLLVDKVSALNASQAVTAALLAKERGHGGQHIELSMLDSAMHFLFPDAYWNKVWCNVKPIPLEWREIAQRSEYEAADGKITITATDKKQMWGLLEVTGLQKFRSDSLGKMRAEALEPVGERLRSMRQQEIFDACQRHGVPCGMFQSPDQVLADPQVRHNNTVEEHTDPVGGPYRAARPPARFARTPSAVQGPAPRMGIDTASVLQELGLSKADVESLRGEGVV